MHYPETPSTGPWIVWSAFTDSLSLILLSHEGVFHGPVGISRTSWGYQTVPNGSLGLSCGLYHLLKA